MKLVLALVFAALAAFVVAQPGDAGRLQIGVKVGGGMRAQRLKHGAPTCTPPSAKPALLPPTAWVEPAK